MKRVSIVKLLTCLILCMAFTACFIIPTSYAITDKNKPDQPAYAVSGIESFDEAEINQQTDGKIDSEPYTIIHDEILSIDIGTGFGEIGYLKEEEHLALRGPGSFHVADDGRIIILDSQNHRILIFQDGTCIGTVLLPNNAYASKMAVIGDLCYVLSYYDSKIYEIPLKYGSEGRVTAADYKSYELPNGLQPYSIQMFLNSSGRLLFVDLDDVAYYLGSDGTFKVGQTFMEKQNVEVEIPEDTKELAWDELDFKTNIRIKNTEWTVKLNQSVDECSAIGVDAKNNLFIEYYDFVDDVYTFMFERTLRIIDPKSNTISYALIEDKGIYTYPDREFFVTESGDVYYMACYNDKVSIQKIIFADSYTSHKNELREAALENDAKVSNLTSTGTEETHSWIYVQSHPDDPDHTFANSETRYCRTCMYYE